MTTGPQLRQEATHYNHRTNHRTTNQEKDITLSDDFVIPLPLRGARFIPKAGPGSRAYAMVIHPETGEKVSSYRIGKPQQWWPWDKDVDEWTGRNGAEVTGDELVFVDMDTPLLPDGTPAVNGFRRLMDLCHEAGEIPDTTGWLLVHTPGHPGRDGGVAKGPGTHAVFRQRPGFPVRTGALSRARCIEIKAMLTCPGSPGYEVLQCPEELPVLPLWLAMLAGVQEPGNTTTGHEGYSFTPSQQTWAKNVSAGDSVLMSNTTHHFLHYDERWMPLPISAEGKAHQYPHESPRQRYQRRVDSKLKAVKHAQDCGNAECHSHALPTGHFGWYENAMWRLRQHLEMPVDDPWFDRSDPEGKHRKVVSSRKFPLIAELDGKAVPLADYRPEKGDKYPGWLGSIPVERRRMKPGELADFVALVLSRAGAAGQRITYARVAFEFNTKHCDRLNVQPIAAMTASRATKIARERELIHETEPAERHRRGQAWSYLPPLYAAGPAPVPEPIQTAKFVPVETQEENAVTEGFLQNGHGNALHCQHCNQILTRVIICDKGTSPYTLACPECATREPFGAEFWDDEYKTGAYDFNRPEGGLSTSSTSPTSPGTASEPTGATVSSPPRTCTTQPVTPSWSTLLSTAGLTAMPSRSSRPGPTESDGPPTNTSSISGTRNPGSSPTGDETP